MTGKRLADKGRDEWTALTINGHVRLRRRVWHDAAAAPGAGGRSLRAADELAGLARRTVSVGARELMCRLNQSSGSFVKTAENLLHAAQLRASKEQVRQIVESQGQAVLAAQQDFTLAPAWTAPQCKVEGTDTTRVYLGVDGVLVPMVTTAEKRKRRENVLKRRKKQDEHPRPQGEPKQGKRKRRRRPLPRIAGGADQAYKEFKLVLFYDEGNERQHCVVTRRDHRYAGMLIDREARRLAFAKADETIANTDGAVWIDRRIDEAHVKLKGRGLDFFHLGEHVHAARRAVFGDCDAAGVSWAGQVLHAVKHEGYEPFWNLVSQQRAKLRSPMKRQALDRLLHYVAQRKHLINYPQFLAKGWQIGSGPTEAACKTVTQRLKGRGRRWNPANAESLSALAAIEQSGQWDAYWPTVLVKAG